MMIVLDFLSEEVEVPLVVRFGIVMMIIHSVVVGWLVVMMDCCSNGINWIHIVRVQASISACYRL
jgi:hypothetical protein